MTEINVAHNPDHSSKQPIISIFGPPGSGKTTVANILSRDFATYIEDPSENPYLSTLSRDPRNFNAAANQMWFLDRLRTFVQSADSRGCLLLDQDPAAIVKVYGKLFFDDGSISIDQYRELGSMLERMEEGLSRWRPRLKIFLNASSAVLRERVTARSNFNFTSSTEWSVRVEKYFGNFCSEFPPDMIFSSESQSPEAIADLIRSIVTKQRSSS